MHTSLETSLLPPREGAWPPTGHGPLLLGAACLQGLSGSLGISRSGRKLTLGAGWPQSPPSLNTAWLSLRQLVTLGHLCCPNTKEHKVVTQEMNAEYEQLDTESTYEVLITC